MIEAITNLVLWVHVLLIVVWLGSDFIIFNLSFSLLKKDLPIDVRIDRAKLAHKYDMWVTKSFLLTPIIGLMLAYLRWRSFDPLFMLEWMSLKLTLFGIILLLAVMLITGASGTVQILEDIKSKSDQKELLEIKLRKRVINLAYPALALHFLIAMIIIIALTGSKDSSLGIW